MCLKTCRMGPQDGVRLPYKWFNYGLWMLMVDHGVYTPTNIIGGTILLYFNGHIHENRVRIRINMVIYYIYPSLGGTILQPPILSIAISGTDSLEVPTMYKAYFSQRDTPPSSMARYGLLCLHFRILDFPSNHHS